MNFLPYVATLLIILSFATQSLLYLMISDKKVHSSYQGHMNASRINASFLEKNCYDHIPTEKQQSLRPGVPKTEKRLKKQKQLVNIAPLLLEGKEARPILYSFLTHLVVHLYGKKSFFPEKTAQMLVDSLIESSKKQKEILHLEKLEFKQKELRQIFYKMLKGTRPLHCKNNRSKKSPVPSEGSAGFPSLYEYIYCSLDPKEDRISIVFAKPEILTALFNEQTAHSILQYQEKTKKLISRAILEKIFQETHFTATDALWKSLDFSQKKSHLPIEITSAEDETTHIFLTRSHYLPSDVTPKNAFQGQDQLSNRRLDLHDRQNHE